MTGQDPTEAVELDTGKPRPARTYDRYLGGKDDHPVDERGYRTRR
ncbi:SAM-dependent methyltransferase [Streptomyces sp. NBC_00637]